MGSGALVLALSTDRCAFVPFSPGPAAVNAYPLSSLVPRRGLGLNLFRVGLNSIPCILRGFRPYIFLKVPFSSFRSVRCDSGVVATYQRILHFHFEFVVPMLAFPSVLFVLFWSLKSLSQWI